MKIFVAKQWITKTFTIYYANYVALIVFSIKYSLLVHAIFVSHDIAQQIKKSGALKKKKMSRTECDEAKLKIRKSYELLYQRKSFDTTVATKHTQR